MPAQDRVSIKTNIVDLMLRANANVGKVLAEALTIIADADFPFQWEGLLDVRRDAVACWTRFLMPVIGSVGAYFHSPGCQGRSRHLAYGELCLPSLPFCVP